MKLLLLLAPACLGLALTSCGTTKAKRNHDQLRTAMMKYNDDQIMDNLIRAHNGFPIMHFDITQVRAEVADTITAVIGGGEEIVHSSGRDPSRSSELVRNSAGGVVTSTLTRTVGVAAAAGSVVTRPFNYSLTPSRVNTISVEVLPVTDKNEVYEAYEAFIALGGGDSVRDEIHNTRPNYPKHSDEEDAVHVGMERDGVYYWIPKKYKKEFFQLCLVASVKRGGPPGSEGAPADAATSDAAKGASISSRKSLPNALRSQAVSPQLPKSDDTKLLKDLLEEQRKTNRELR